MDTRIALIGIILEKDEAAEPLNGVLHLAGQQPQGICSESVKCIIGRHGNHLRVFSYSTP